jgi:hypothetical protein
MYENQEITERNPLNSLKELLIGALSFGVILASTHGAIFSDHHKELSPTDFAAKIVSELHTHSYIHIQHGRVLVDPKSLRQVRSEGDKTAESDGLRGNWDVYQA